MGLFIYDNYWTAIYGFLWILQIYAGKSATLRPREMDSGTISFTKISNPRYGSLLGRGCVPLDEIYVAVLRSVLRPEFSGGRQTAEMAEKSLGAEYHV